jgi:hypothetical protein
MTRNSTHVSDLVPYLSLRLKQTIADFLQYDNIELSNVLPDPTPLIPPTSVTKATLEI